MPTMQYLTTTIFDHGAIKQTGQALKQLGVTRPLLVTDRGIVAAGIAERLIDAVSGLVAAVFDATPANPTEEAVEDALSLYREAGCDGLVALGGGSSMDLAKGVGLWATHEGPYARFGATQRGSKHIKAIPPLIALPTTAGTGSEVSVGAVIILRDGRKETFISPFLVPARAICDPELTLGLPKGLTAATGMDAVTHCIEAVLSPMVHPPAEAIGLDGVHRAVREGWLERAVADGADKDARWHMMMASFEGALAFVKGLGGVHSLSHATGRIKALNLHHGALNAIYLPHLLRFNAGAAPSKYARLREAMGLAAGADLADAMAALNARIAIPENLKSLGVTSAHGPDIVEFAMTDLAHFTNAREIQRSDYEKLFEAALG
jgi:4-hydroxybutyrate dehydrogenase